MTPPPERDAGAGPGARRQPAVSARAATVSKASALPHRYVTAAAAGGSRGIRARRERAAPAMDVVACRGPPPRGRVEFANRPSTWAAFGQVPGSS